MAITTYAELQTAVANWLDRNDLTSRIPEFIALAEADLNRTLRTRLMEERATSSADDEFIALPTDFQRIETLVLEDASGIRTPLIMVTAEQLAASRWGSTVTGRPQYYALIGAEFQLYPTPDQTYDFLITYYQSIPALTDVATSNWVLAAAPDAYLFGALREAGVYLRDPDMMNMAQSRYADAVESLRLATRRQIGALRTEPGQLTLDRPSFNIYRGY